MRHPVASKRSCHAKLLDNEFAHHRMLSGGNAYKVGALRQVGDVQHQAAVAVASDAARQHFSTCEVGHGHINSTTVLPGQSFEKQCCGVLGKGERVFITCKMPEDIILNPRTDDRIETYVVFTTSHDGTGSVRCMVTNVRVVCSNTLNFAMKHNSGRIAFRHSSKVMSRLDLLNKENAEFAYKTLGLWNEYEKCFKESLEHLRNIKLSERDLDNIIAEITLADEAKKAFLETRSIYHEDIATRGRNIFIGMKEAMESGIGQDILDKGTALWAINGVTTFFQNEANFKNGEVMFDNMMDGNVYKKVNKAYEMLIAA